ncbi:hypothetical protein NQ314_002764 [Rhamnusium bicolor]|uniref:PiggyBac transposable element-derived protein domain-containing protein n=1 Tax=Rhamnusium bicolor TaxID=1586634 RepID=A0AAV8ZRC3_9CUCU|nr:hypothetical protein NQ314_002764 [Rhamnusium bicolor]
MTKKTRYGVKFYSVCTTDDYGLNLQIYSGKSDEAEGLSKIQTLVHSLMEPFLDSGHNVFMDNFYNSVDLSGKLLKRKMHTTGTLRQNHKKNPTAITQAKLKKGQHLSKRSKNVYISNWKDKLEVLAVYH